MIKFLGDPVIIVTAVVALIGLFIFWRFRSSGETSRLDERTTIFVFPRNAGFQEIKAKTFDGLVTYGFGGFVEDAKRIIPLFFGRVGMGGIHNPNAGRGRVNIYATRPGDAAPIDFAREDFEPDKVARERFEAFSSISVDREVNRGKLDAGKGLFTENLIAIAAFVAVVMAVITWSIVLILPLTPLPVKSANSNNELQITPTPSGTIPINPTTPNNSITATPSRPVIYPKTLH